MGPKEIIITWGVGDELIVTLVVNNAPNGETISEQWTVGTYLEDDCFEMTPTTAAALVGGDDAVLASVEVLG